jgi:hypothetical protein
MFNLSFRSIVFAFGVSIAFVVVLLQGVSMLQLAKAALVVSVVFLGFMVGEAAMERAQKRAVAKRRRNDRER